MSRFMTWATVVAVGLVAGSGSAAESTESGVVKPALQTTPQGTAAATVPVRPASYGAYYVPYGYYSWSYPVYARYPAFGAVGAYAYPYYAYASPYYGFAYPTYAVNWPGYTYYPAAYSWAWASPWGYWPYVGYAGWGAPYYYYPYYASYAAWPGYYYYGPIYGSGFYMAVGF